MIKTELVSLCQQQAQQRKAQEYVLHVQRKRRTKKAVTGILVAAFFITGFGVTGKSDLETIQAKQVIAKENESEQKYIVRYGIMEDSETILTRDGNLWSLAGPEFETGTEVRVLFDSCETVDVTDDIIIDITERR